MKLFALLSTIALCASCVRRQFEITEEGDFTQVPLFFMSCSDMPLLKAEIEGMSVSLTVDLGSNGDLMLKERILDAILNKEFKRLAERYNFKGTQFTSSLYEIPKFQIGPLFIKNILSGNETRKMEEDSKVGFWSQKELDQQFYQIDGRIGIGVLSRFHCYFDLAHRNLYLAQDLQEIRKCYLLDQFIEVPFELHNDLVILTAETDFGVKKFILDTGASVSILRKSQIVRPKRDWIKSQLYLEGFDFGRREFFLYDFIDFLPVDGVLGIDFFKKHGIHLDFEHQKAYIQKKHEW